MEMRFEKAYCRRRRHGLEVIMSSRQYPLTTTRDHGPGMNGTHSIVATRPQLLERHNRKVFVP